MKDKIDYKIAYETAMIGFKMQMQEIERLNNIIKTKDEGIKALTEDLCDTTKELEEGYERIKGLEVASSKLDYEATIYANRIDKAIEYIKYLNPAHYSNEDEDNLLSILKGEDKGE